MAQLTFEDFLVLRRPLLPIQSALNALDQNRTSQRLGDHLKQVFTAPLAKEALYVASPELCIRLTEWLPNQLGTQDEKLIQALTKYYLRMSSRCTPYGLFAGCSLLQFDARTEVGFNGIRRYRRLDTSYVSQLSHWIEQLPGVAQQLRYYPNNSLYQIGNQYRYMAYHLEDGKRSYTFMSADAMPEIDALFAAATSGSTLPSLADVLHERGISIDEAIIFLDELVTAQLLVSELEPSVTGDEYFQRLVAKINVLSGVDALGQTLDEVNALLNQPESATGPYQSIKHVLNSRLLPVSGQHLFQTDLYYDAQPTTLTKQVARKLTPVLNRLLVFNRATVLPELEQFKREFYDRYQEQEVPLLQALDNEVGIPYGESGRIDFGHTPLIEDLTINLPDSSQTRSSLSTNLSAFLLDKLTHALRVGATEIKITDEELKRLEQQQPASNELPVSAYAFGSLIASSAQAIDEGDFQFVLQTMAGPSGANLLSRFCHGDDALTEKVKASLAYEASQYPDVLLAEIAHLPEARLGNILMRPTLRPFEIPYLATSSANADQLIALTDLFVSVPQGKHIVLRSKRLQKRIIPRLTSAHNYAKGLPVYKFLADLQHQESPLQVSWDWALLRNQVYLPRVTYQNIILSRATWNLQADVHLVSSVPAFLALQQTLHLDISRYVVLREGDNELLLDLSHDVCLAILMDTLRKSGSVQISEFLQTPEQCWLTDEHGNYTNEVIFPLRSKRLLSHTSNAITPTGTPVRHHPIGSQWLYFKIYTGEKTADKLLTDAIEPLVLGWMQDQLIDRFFFVRYRDPYPHLRVRFRGTPGQLDGFHHTLIRTLNESLAAHFQQGVIHNVVIDTYRPEIERYGTDTIAESEFLFHLDSLAVIDCLRELTNDDVEDFRWLLALRGVDDLLEAFGYTLPAKVHLLKQLQAAFFKEFGGDADLRAQLNAKFRAVSVQIDAVLNVPETVLTEPLCTALSSRKAQLEKLATTLTPKVLHVDSLVSSYLHMFLNRLFISNHRLHELVIYHYLFRQYSAKLARSSE